jgi:hypothetical protein
VPVTAAAMPAQQVKGRDTPVIGYKIAQNRGSDAAGPALAGPALAGLDRGAADHITRAGTP